jgi:hypothetical protein
MTPGVPRRGRLRRSPQNRETTAGRVVDAPVAIDDEAADAPAQVEGWTNGGRLRTNAITALILGALLVVPTAASLALSGGQTVPAAAKRDETPTASSQARAGEFATGYVKAWLAPSGPNALDTYYRGVLTVPADQPPKLGQVTIADIQPAGTGRISVTVAADVDNARRYFDVPLQVTADSVTALGLPAPAAAPTRSQGPRLAYDEDVLRSGPAGQAMSAFLNALLAGQGDISRYTSPGLNVVAVSPAPYARAELQTARSIGTEPAPTKDGSRLQVLATAVLTDAGKRRFLAGYALELTTRGGRWEVSSQQLAPQTVPDPTPSPGTTPITTPSK